MSIDHENAAALLPWYVNGSLSAEEHRAVERHLRDCLPCRAELKTERRLAALVARDLPEHEAVDRNFERLVERIESRGTGGPTAGRAARAAAAGVALLAVGLVAGGLWFSLDGTRPGERVAPESFSTAADPAARGAARIDLIFADSADPSDIDALLEEIGGTVVGGPSSLGRYTVELRRLEPGDDEVAAVLRRLDADDRVRFAGRSFIGE